MTQTATPRAATGIQAQPLNTIEWIDANELRANDYNPNHVAPPEMALLKISILENGWTQPIVARPDGEIVDGFHRWTLGSTDPDVQALTGGLVPVVRLALEQDPATQRMATIRHNRARGQHHVLKMADIVADLSKQGVTDQQIAERLQMDPEEVERLLERGSMIERVAKDEFGEGWIPG